MKLSSTVLRCPCKPFQAHKENVEQPERTELQVLRARRVNRDVKARAENRESRARPVSRETRVRRVLQETAVAPEPEDLTATAENPDAPDPTDAQDPMDNLYVNCASLGQRYNSTLSGSRFFRASRFQLKITQPLVLKFGSVFSACIFSA